PVPLLVTGEALALLVHPEVGVERHVDGGGGVAPRGRFLLVDTQALRDVGVGPCVVGRVAQVPGGHQVGVDVVVAERRVLVRARDAVDVEHAVPVVVPQRAPQAGGLDQQLHAHLSGEPLVAGGVEVAHRGVGDVGGDV